MRTIKVNIPIPQEEWRDISGYEGMYQISTYGRVWSVPRGGRKGRILRTSVCTSGYESVNLCKNGKPKTFLVHRLVAKAFITNPNNFPEINHKDERKMNNCVWNLEFCTRKYNENYGTKRMRAAAHHDYAKSAKLSALHHDYTEVGRKQAKPILQISYDGKIVQRWESMQEIHRVMGYSTGNISRACNGKIKRVYGHIWRFEEGYKHEKT